MPGDALLSMIILTLATGHEEQRRQALLVAPEGALWVGHAADLRRWCGPRAGAPRTTETGGRGVVGGGGFREHPRGF